MPAPVRAFALGSVALGAISLFCGCGEKPFGKVNGQVITKEEYLRKLERQQIPLAQNVSISAERLVIDQLVGDKIILTEAARMGVMPSDDDVNKAFRVAQQLFENGQPGKKYEEELAKQGSTPEENKLDLRVQTAETNVYAKLMNLGEDEIRKIYSERRDQLGLPARSQLRVILLPPNAAEVATVTRELTDVKNFEKVAKTTNIPQLRTLGGLQILPNQSLPPTLQAKITQMAEGAMIGPVSWPIGQNQSLKAWIKMEKKIPAFTLPLEDAAPIIRRSLVQQKLGQPENAKIRDQVMKQKLDAKFESTDAPYTTVWEAVKKQAVDAGVGQSQTAPAAGVTGGLGATAPGATGATTPGTK